MVESVKHDCQFVFGVSGAAQLADAEVVRLRSLDSWVAVAFESSNAVLEDVTLPELNVDWKR